MFIADPGPLLIEQRKRSVAQLARGLHLKSDNSHGTTARARESKRFSVSRPGSRFIYMQNKEHQAPHMPSQYRNMIGVT